MLDWGVAMLEQRWRQSAAPPGRFVDGAALGAAGLELQARPMAWRNATIRTVAHHPALVTSDRRSKRVVYHAQLQRWPAGPLRQNRIENENNISIKSTP